MKKDKAFLIAIGDELLMGQIIDTNSGWIAQRLEETGIQTIKRLVIPDSSEAIMDALDESIKEAEYIFITGGLGPTRDDLTKKVLADYFHSQLVRHESVYQHIVKLSARRKRPLLPEVEKQAMIPEGCRILTNEIGTAPGMWFEKEGRYIISLPGVPYEMKEIFKTEVLPKLSRQHEGYYREHRHFLLMNSAEADIANKIEDIEAALPSFIKLAYLPGMGALKLRLSGGHKEEMLLRNTLDDFASRIRARLGSLIAGENNETIEAIVGKLSRERKLSIGLAESCTGGLIASRLTDIRGSSDYFKGGIVSYAYEVKETLLKVDKETLQKYGAVSKQTVLQMAGQARRSLDTDIALAASGILGPGGGTKEKPVGIVWMAIADKNKTEARCFYFHYDRLLNKERATNTALEWLRKWLTEESLKE